MKIRSVFNHQITKSPHHQIIFLFFIFHFSLFTCSAQRLELSKKDTSEIDWLSGKKFYVIKVEKGETLYSLSKRFKVSQDEIIQYNPDLKFGLKVKMKLQIPTFHTQPEPVKSSAPQPLAPPKSSYNVSFLLPLALWKNFLPEFVNDSSGEQIVLPETMPQLEFYEGAVQAAESLSTKDFKIHLKVLDTSNDTSRVTLHLKDPALKTCDYLVVAGSPSILKQANQFSIQQNIPLLTFSFNASDYLKNNPNAYAFIGSSNEQCLEAGKFCAAKFNGANALIVKAGSSKETERALAFSNGWNQQAADAKIKTVDCSKENFQPLFSSLAKGKNNLVFVPSSNEDFIGSLAGKLNDTTSTYQITLVGIPTWQYFETLDPVVLQNLNTHIFTSSQVAINEKKSTAFKDKYTNIYMKDPSDASFQGFDAIKFIQQIHAIKKDNDKKDQPLRLEGLYAGYDFVSSNGMNENHRIYFLRYSNFELIEVK